MDSLSVEVPPNVSQADSVPASANTPGFSGEWKDFAKDIALLEAQKPELTTADAVVPEISPLVVETPAPEPAKAPTVAPQPVPQQAIPPVSPEQPKPAATVTIPEKFLTPDGKLDEARLVNSYKEAEKTLKRLQNEKHSQPQQVPVPVVATPEPNTFEAQVYQDFVTSGLDQKAAAALVPTITKLFAAASDAGYARAMSEVADFKKAHEEAQMRDELKSLVAADPSLMTPDGMNALIEIRQTQPWLNASPQPWKAAWQVKIANESLRKASTGQVQTPTPKAVTAPPAPVTAAPQSAEAPLVLNSQEAIRAHLAGLNDKEKGEFFKRNLGKNIKW